MRNLLPLCLMTVLTLVAAFALGGSSQAAESMPSGWHTDVDAAWRAAQAQGRPLLVFVTREQCVFCVKMKRGTLVDPRVAAAIRNGYVPLVVDATRPSPLSQELAVKAFPTTFVISPQAVVLDRIDGYLAPEPFNARLDTLTRQTARMVQTR